MERQSLCREMVMEISPVYKKVVVLLLLILFGFAVFYEERQCYVKKRVKDMNVYVCSDGVVYLE